MDTNNRTSPPPSEATSWSHITQSTANPDLARIFVQLSNGTKFYVPVAQNSTVHDLHGKALQRATKFGFRASLEDTFLQTTGASAIALCDEDSVHEVLDLTDSSTFNLCTLENHVLQSTTTSSIQPQAAQKNGPAKKDEAVVHIRWVTLEDAISHSRLSAIQADRTVVPQDTTLEQFYNIAVARFEENNPKQHPQKVNLFLKECRLVGKNNSMSLYDLKLVGSKEAPLDVFVDLDTSEVGINVANLTDSTSVGSLWGFETTKRGVATLTTTLKMLIKEIVAGGCTLDKILGVLFELTHFPPLLIAFRHLYESNLEDERCSSSLRLFAYALHILCLQIVPSEICPSPEMALESSRQVVAWLTSIEPGVTLKAEKVQIREKKDQQLFLSGLLPHKYDVKISVTHDSKSSTQKELFVALDKEDEQLAALLGRAIHESFSSLWDFYFQLGIWHGLVNHKKLQAVQPSDFDILLQTTASSARFRMIGPLQLGSCLAAELPVITLSSAGYVSVYDQEYYDCSEKRFFTWNAIHKKEIMKDTNPGQFLTQKLEPIITERKKDRTFEVDAWSDKLKAAADFGTPDEAIVVCMDTSGSMASVMPTGWISATGVLPSRLTEVKEFFKNLALRVSALHLSTYLGLVTFSAKSQVVTKQALTPVHLNFEDSVEKLTAQSTTAIFDGIDKAREMLYELRQLHPGVKCRIIILTDGDDNASSRLPETVCECLFDQDIVLDSVVIGTEITRELFKISKATGGYAFAPKTQQEFFQIFLLETLVDIRTRPDIVKVPWAPQQSWLDFLPKSKDMSSPYDFPPCRPHPNQSDYFIALQDADRYLTRQASTSSNVAPSVHSISTRSASTGMTGTTLGSAGGSARIILSEVKEMIKNPHQYMDVYVSERNMGFWKVVMQGPPASPYANGAFMLYLEIGSDFPLKPPSARFITPMLHPNITKHGRICHPIFDREWTGTTRVFQILQHIWGILMSLEARDAVDPLSTLKFWTDPVQGRREVENYVGKFASRSRASLRTDIVGDDVSDISSVRSDNWENDSVSTARSGESRGTVTLGSNNGSASSVPPSYRSNISSPARTPGSTISSFLAAQRRPPPLIATPDQATGRADQAVSDRASSAASSDAGAGGRRTSRRASFFNKFKK